MADVSGFVLCDVLCFLSHKFVNTSIKVLKSILMDFYSSEDIASAKKHLLDDISGIETLVKFPYTPHRRDGAERTIREVDDIIAIFTCLDENKLIDKLPKYVANGPDSMPSVRLYESDLNAIMVMLNKLNTKMGEYGEAIAILSGELRALQTRRLPVQPPAPPSAVAASVCQQLYQPPDLHSASSLDFPTLAEAQSADTVIDQSSRQNDWATLVSTPLAHANRFAALRSADDDEQSDASYGRPFTTVTSKRNKRTRNRVSSPLAATKTASATVQPQRAPTVLGKSTAIGNNVVAARKIRKKSVLCVDNLSTTCTADDIVAFVTKQLAVEVITCFEAKPRRRRGEAVVNNRKAFRLCICEDDRDRLLDATAWPDSVMISQWFFKVQSTDDKRPRLDGRSDSTAANRSSTQSSVIARGATVPADPAAAQIVQDTNVAGNDETILAAPMDCSNNGGD